MGLLGWIGVWAALAGAAPNAELVKVGQSELRFASVAEGSQLLGADDEYFRAMSAYDRLIRAVRSCSSAEFAAFAKSQARAWTKEELAALRAAAAWVDQALAAQRVTLPLPKVVTLVKTSGAEESHTAYTRQAAVIIPANMIKGGPRSLGILLAHELFHVASRAMPLERRAVLYGLARFRRLEGFALPAELEPRRITDPDGIDLGWAVALSTGEVVAAVLQGNDDQPRKDGAFLSAFQIMLLVMEEKDGHTVPKRDPQGRPVLRSEFAQFKDYMTATRSKTPYVIHPDEVMASNFELILTAGAKVPEGLPEDLAGALRP